MQKNQLYQVRINKHKNTLKKNPTLRVGFFYFYKLMNSIEDKPIGFFDSGVGGTSIWKEVHQLLPNESTIYLADSKNAPYGKKSKEKIIEFSIKNTEFLLNKNAKIIIVACNTATTNAISILRKKYDIPFIGIEPAIKPAALLSKTGAIGILATKGTLTSKLFEKTAKEYTKNITTIEQEGEGLVPLIEDGKLNSQETLTSDYVFIRARNSEYNYTENPSFISGSTGEVIYPYFINNPQTFPTTVGLYNDSNDLLAVAKLSRPIQKDFTKEALVRVKLDF